MGSLSFIGLILQPLFMGLIGGVLLRAACGLHNKWFAGGEAPDAMEPAIASTETDQLSQHNQSPTQADDGNPYRAPLTASYNTSHSQAGVEVPLFPKAFGIMLLGSFLTMIFTIGTMIAMLSIFGPSPEIAVAARVATFVLGFFIYSLCIKRILPTTFNRAMVITLLMVLVAVLIGVAIWIFISNVSWLLQQYMSNRSLN